MFLISLLAWELHLNPTKTPYEAPNLVQIDPKGSQIGPFLEYIQFTWSAQLFVARFT